LHRLSADVVAEGFRANNTYTRGGHCSNARQPNPSEIQEGRPILDFESWRTASPI